MCVCKSIFVSMFVLGGLHVWQEYICSCVLVHVNMDCIHMYIHVFWQSLGSLSQEHLPCVFGDRFIMGLKPPIRPDQLASPRDHRQACNKRITGNTSFLLLNMRITGKPYHSWRYVDTGDWTRVPVLQGKLFTSWSISTAPKFYDFLILILFNFDEAGGRKRSAFEGHHFICLGKSTYFKYSLYLWSESGSDIQINNFSCC